MDRWLSKVRSPSSPKSPWERPNSGASLQRGLPGSTAGSGSPRAPGNNPRPASAVSRRHDQSYKLLFSIPLAVEQLIRHFLDTDLADELDFERVEVLATERIAAGLVRSHSDLLWKIHFRGSSRHLLLAIEFQSAADRYMSVRIHYYVAATYHAMTATRPRRGELAPGGLLPPTLAVTIYNGQSRWTAHGDIFELIEPVGAWLAGRQPRLRHEVLDLRERACQPLPNTNVVSWIARLETEMIYAGVEELKERAHREGLGRGRAEGRATLVCRQARLKFGAETAEGLSKFLKGITDPERIARIGDRIIECETGAELLAHAREDQDY